MSRSAHLFVYGTLRPPLKNNHKVLCFNYPKVLPYLRGERAAYLDGAVLYDMGSFPAAIPGPGRLQGVVLELDSLAFTILDPLEGHPDLYYREIVTVTTTNGELQAWIYWAPEDLALTGRLMESGDWLSKARQD